MKHFLFAACLAIVSIANPMDFASGAEGAGILQACGHRRGRRRKRPRWTYAAARRWPGSTAGGNRGRRQQSRRVAIACRRTRTATDAAWPRPGPLRARGRLRSCRRQPKIRPGNAAGTGQARVAARIGDKACADILLRSERVARAARRGLWADPNFAPLRRENLDRIAAAQGQFALVEGKVLSVRESGATIYLNFGRRWTRDFTVTILKRHRREFAAAGIDPKGLEGRPIRVRGWIEQRGCPIMDAVAPEQIERAE